MKSPPRGGFGIAHLALVLLATPAIVSSGCGQSAVDSDKSEARPTGSVGLALQVSPDAVVTTGTYTITGPNGFTAMGTLAVGPTSNVPVVLSGLPVGTGYTLAANAVANDGVTTCSGSVPFDVTTGMMSTVIVHLVCRVPPNVGGIVLGGDTNVCASLDGVGASPAEALVGGTLSLNAIAHDSDAGPGPITFVWSATSGSFDAPSSATPKFTCTSAGVVTIGAVVSDGAPGCAEALTLTVACTAP